MTGTLFTIVFLAAYFIPAVIAVNRNHRNATAIAALDLLLGWTAIGWIVALVWSLTADVEKKQLTNAAQKRTR